MAVFVLDQRKRPLMPCSEKRARQMLARRRAAVHKMRPFTIRLKDRLAEESSFQPLWIKIDPGIKTIGLAVVREGEQQPESQKAGTYTGRVVIRKTGSFNIQLSNQRIQGISWKYFTLIQRGDGYSNHRASTH